MPIPTPKHPLRFSRDGTFRVLMMSDLQESASYDPRSLRSVEALMELAKPDLVLWGGDNCYGPEIGSEADLQAFLEIFTAPMERRGIPWAHVFGNHDHDARCPIGRQQAMYEAFPMCVSGHTGPDVHGKSNFVLPVLGRDGAVRCAVWGLDTNNTAGDLDGLVPGGDMAGAGLLPENPLSAGRWGVLWFDQLLWYYETSRMLEALCGGKVPGLLCMHVAPHEFQAARANPERCVRSGVFEEPLDPAVLNSGLFSLLLQRGDVRTIACGHTHRNDFEAEYCGIRLCWDACAGYRCYGTDELRGGRLFLFRESDPGRPETRMLRTLPYV